MTEHEIGLLRDALLEAIELAEGLSPDATGVRARLNRLLREAYSLTESIPDSNS